MYVQVSTDSMGYPQQKAPTTIPRALQSLLESPKHMI